jgi:hypothetical protein
MRQCNGSYCHAIRGVFTKTEVLPGKHEYSLARTEAETAVRKAPSDHAALGKLDMAVKVLRAGTKAFADAEAELTQPGQTPSDKG